ncbi:type VI secretion system-associated lipoprotein [Hahella sp. CCB-MM4]|uniref:type VI secretion system lipoprotein TssJ n=1 Tax=Hahella sp. (strain CCB-MM4) TaxID=1926491 RepID=UPI000B9A8A9E|nr:type VI secretion system lipoprotein TssJ [Hahella sp. CCB-MM4]OZG70980.1 type VI secretion system-associated lipoprotein [Hahella sp. CCB-MM4]
MKCLKQTIFPIISGILMVLIAGCSTVGGVVGRDTTVTLNITTATDINPDEDGRASPVILNFYALENERQFEQEDFIALYQDPDAVLGRDLIFTTKFKEFTPGEERTESLVVDDRTRYIGIMAEYIRYEDAATKIVMPIDANTGNKFRMFIDRLSMRYE